MNILEAMGQDDFSDKAKAYYDKVYKEIADAIANAGSPKRATREWVAGILMPPIPKSYDRWKRALNNPDLTPEYRVDFQNKVIAVDIAANNNMLKKVNGGYEKNDKGSRFAKYLTLDVHSSEEKDVNDMSFKELRGMMQDMKGQADKDWYESLPPIEQMMIDKYQEMNEKEYAFLSGLKNDKDSKYRYVNRVERLEDSDPESYNVLKNLGFITKENYINNNLVTKFFETMGKFYYRHLRSFNRNISSSSDRRAAQNANNRRTSQEIARDLEKADGDTMSNDEMGAASTRMGTDDKMPTSRQQQRSKILQGRSQAFDQNTRRAKVARNESKRFSFKNFLIESTD